VVLSGLWGTIDPLQYRAGSKIDVAGRGRGWSVVESRRDL